jgi:hypothetical protein
MVLLQDTVMIVVLVLSSLETPLWHRIGKRWLLLLGAVVVVVLVLSSLGAPLC